MGYLNYEFFDAFKELDNLCRDIYGESADHKLGVTMYIEDMDRRSYQGAGGVPGWSYDYERLREVRDLRNELAHSRNSISFDICSEEDVDFVRSFKMRILNQTDPLAMYRRAITSHSIVKPVSKSKVYSKVYSYVGIPISEYKPTEPVQSTAPEENQKHSTGCAVGFIVYILILAGLLGLALWIALNM